METQRMPTHKVYAGNSRVNPNYPLPSSLPTPQDFEQSPSTNGLARTTSRRRRASGSEHTARIPADHFPQPPAPEVPKAPPVSYRSPFNAENYGPPKGNYPSPSFAERARALTGNLIATQPLDLDHEPAPPPVKPVRRGSLNRPIGGVYSEIQQYKRDSYPPPNGPVSPRRFSNPTSPHQQQAIGPYPSSREVDSTKQQQNSKPQSLQPQSSTRRASAGLAQVAGKEWAPDRSPLQKLEVKLSDISKEEKRARVAEAEQRLRASQAGDKRRTSDRERDSFVDRTSSRRASATTAEQKPLGSRQISDQAPPSFHTQPRSGLNDDNPLPENRSREAGNVPRSQKRRESSSAGSYPQMTSGRIMPGPNHAANREDVQGNSAGQERVAQRDQQQERGVRFQGQDGTEDLDSYSPEFDSSELKSRRRSSGIEALARSDEARSVQRDKFRRDPATMNNRTASKMVPAQQKDLYSNKADTDHDAASAASYGGTADPVPRHAVKGRGQASTYEVPPQTAAGINARQAVGFGSELPGAVEAPGHRRHHLSDIFHRGHDHAADNHEQIGAKPRHLDEWRRAETARLTAADFGPTNESEDEQKAWWEGAGSGSRRKRGRGLDKGAQSLQASLPNTTGKSRSDSNRQSSPLGKAEADRGKTRLTQTRQYLGEDEYARLKDESHQPHENHLTHFLHRSGHDHDRGLASAYSYSCPNLAIHDPSHQDHICQPYLSKELTQSMRSIRIRPAPELATFDPPLYLKCGPLLRYTGLKRDRRQMKARSGGVSSIERETWRGSVMIVSADADSSYDPAPTLRLYSEPMDMLPPPSRHTEAENSQDLPSEYVDPIAGLPKLSRSGKTVYVKPVDDLEHAKDLSRLEDDDGLFEETRTAAVPTAYGTPDFRASSANPKPVRREGRATKKGHHVRGVRLHAERGVTFWRFNLEVELGAEQNRIAYSINNSPSIGFWVPARGHSMNVMFHSCNGFSMSVK